MKRPFRQNVDDYATPRKLRALSLDLYEYARLLEGAITRDGIARVHGLSAHSAGKRFERLQHFLQWARVRRVVERQDGSAAGAVTVKIAPALLMRLSERLLRDVDDGRCWACAADRRGSLRVPRASGTFRARLGTFATRPDRLGLFACELRDYALEHGGRITVETVQAVRGGANAAASAAFRRLQSFLRRALVPVTYTRSSDVAGPTGAPTVAYGHRVARARIEVEPTALMSLADRIVESLSAGRCWVCRHKRGEPAAVDKAAKRTYWRLYRRRWRARQRAKAQA